MHTHAYAHTLRHACRILSQGGLLLRIEDAQRMVKRRSEKQQRMKQRGEERTGQTDNSDDQDEDALQHYNSGDIKDRGPDSDSDSSKDTESTTDTEERSAQEFKEQCDDLVERMKKPSVHDWSDSSKVEDSNPLDLALTLGRGLPPPMYDDSSGACHGLDLEDEDEEA